MSATCAAVARPWLDPNALPIVELEGVSKRFDGVAVVDDINLRIYPGELFCLLGGSGSGKTTLLRLLAGFEVPNAGSIRIAGRSMNAVPPYARPVNMMFQSYALFPHLSVEKNIAFGLVEEGVKRRDISARVADMLALVKLTPYARRKPHQLSGGQRQRVALARALAKQPKLLLLDEPLGALDKKLREETQFELIRIQEELGTTFVVVTHDQDEAMTLASRIGVMEHGKLVQVGEPWNLYEFPQTRFVADFIGSVNLFEGRIVEDEADRVRIASAEAGCDFTIGHGVSGVLSQSCWVALRPEKIRLSRTRPEQTNNVMTGVVEEVGYRGDVSHYRIILDSGKRVLVTQANLDRYAEDPIRWDERVYLHWQHYSAVVLMA